MSKMNFLHKFLDFFEEEVDEGNIISLMDSTFKGDNEKFW